MVSRPRTIDPDHFPDPYWEGWSNLIGSEPGADREQVRRELLRALDLGAPLPQSAVNYFTLGQCLAFGACLSARTGWPTYGLIRPYFGTGDLTQAERAQASGHVVCMPDRHTIVDANGRAPRALALAEYSAQWGTVRPYRLRDPLYACDVPDTSWYTPDLSTAILGVEVLLKSGAA